MFKNLNIAMWSGPRNLSTALMRSFANRNDITSVLDEPFYASYLISSNKDHPLKDEVIASQLNDADEVKVLCQKSYNGITYQKHMTQHILDNDYKWIDSLCNCFLIRNPESVIKSFMKSWNKGEFIDIGFKQQYDIFEYVCKNINDHPPVIDADLLRQNPEKVLKSFCEVVNIPWDTKMLEWEPGLKDYDGVWAKHWYSSVMHSSSFKPIDKKEINLNKSERRIADKAMPIYQELYKYVV